MTDIKDTAKRSLNMKAIRSKNTKPEIILRKELFKKGIRYRKNVKYIPGHPDIYLKNIILRFLFTDVFGINIQTVNMLTFPNLT